MHSDRDLVPGLKRVLAPAIVDHVGRIAGFHNPVPYFARLRLFVEL